ncbi:MAG TPA: transketolase [Thermoanaerobaculia bacterium]|nr:transketolase [Thermoanaerobaculia bacterium]
MSDPETSFASPAAPGTDTVAINTLRMLAVDMVERANSGHPGAPMGQAPMAYTLFTRFLRFDPAAPEWLDRDRFVLSCGHASALLYGLLHLSGYDLGLDDLAAFRQLHSRTPGHPENFLTPGVETTTGPLGQGLANAVGMAMAERLLAQQFNRQGFTLFDHRVWVLASDGDAMEGVASEASSLAGHLGLGKLNVLWDDNRITIDGSTDLATSEDVVARYAAYGWHTQTVTDGNDLASLESAMRAALAETGRPSLIAVRTHIGYGSPNKQDTADAHGAPLGAEEVSRTKQALGWPLEPELLVPDVARAAFAPAGERGAAARAAWEETRRRFAAEHPEAAAELARRERGELPTGALDALPAWTVGDGSVATRKASGKALNALAPSLPELIGGSADLSGSNNTAIAGELDFSRARAARYVRYGVREHAMGAALNGMALSGLLRPYGGTFLIFSDYMRPAIRLAALMRLPVLYVFTHDSIFLGEDGPTHQPIAQLPALRAIPRLHVIRPADANETAAAWASALQRRDGPTALVLTRQGLPILEGTREHAREGVERGGYVLRDAEGAPDLLLLATGSEVQLAVGVGDRLAGEGVQAQVVSLPCWERFAAQDRAYRDQVLPPGVHRRLAIEAASPFGWERWIGDRGAVHGIDGFGASAPYQELAKEYGFTVDALLEKAKSLL